MNFQKPEVIPTTGKSGAVVPIRDNVLLPDIDWPPIEIIGKLYKSNRIEAFDKKYHEKLQRELGFYCDLSSIRSEDAITWSLFGYISKMDSCTQNKFYNELLEKLNLAKDELLSIELWKRLPHPDTFVSGGPEIDVFILGKKYYILVECKWISSIAKNQGKNKKLNQLQVRELFIEKIGTKIYPEKEGLILLVARENLPENLNGKFLSWDELSKFNNLPGKMLFNEYLSWKKEYIK